MPHNAFLITGANAGLGKDVARQLGLRADVDSIYLACRDEAKAQAAQAKTLTGPLVDQSAIVADFADQATQDHAYQAIHRFLDKRSDHVRPG